MTAAKKENGRTEVNGAVDLQLVIRLAAVLFSAMAAAFLCQK